MMFKRIYAAIQFDGMSVNNVAALSKIPQSSLQRFCSGQQGLQMDGLQNVCEVLGLELVRRLDVDELKEHMEEQWGELKAEAEAVEYDPLKSEAWREVSDKLWPKYARKNKLDASDSHKYAEWEAEEYLGWSVRYDDEHYSEWEAESCSEWEAEERERLEACGWIVIAD